MRIYIFLLFAYCGLVYVQAYKIPNVKLEILSQGFRVSIPDEPGVEYVTFVISWNRGIGGIKYWAKIESPINGSWIYENKKQRLNNNGQMNIWITVQHNQLVYRRNGIIYQSQVVYSDNNDENNGTQQNNQLLYRKLTEPILFNQSQVVYSDNNDENNGTQQNNQLLYLKIIEPIMFNQSQVFHSTNKDDDYGRPHTIPTTTVNPIIDISTSAYEPKNCEASITRMQNRNTCKGELIFEENFELGLNLTRWQYEVRLPLDMGDAEFVLYDYDIANIQAANGVFTIVPTLWNDDRPGTNLKQGVLDLGRRCTGKQNRLMECRREPEGLVHNILPPIKTARINTKDSFSFKYGLVEIRAKLPRGDWLFPLLLLEPLTNYYGVTTAYASGQLRIAFARGNDNLLNKDGINVDGRTLYGGAILSTMTSLREQFLVQTTQNKHFSDDYHVYSLIWSDQKLILKVDGREYGTIDGGFANSYEGDLEQKNAWKIGEYMAPFDQEFYITLGVAAGGHVDFPDDSISNSIRKPWNNTSPKAAFKFWRDRINWKNTFMSPELKVDYVRVYAI